MQLKIRRSPPRFRLRRSAAVSSFAASCLSHRLIGKRDSHWDTVDGSKKLRGFARQTWPRTRVPRVTKSREMPASAQLRGGQSEWAAFFGTRQILVGRPAPSFSHRIEKCRPASAQQSRSKRTMLPAGGNTMPANSAPSDKSPYAPPRHSWRI